jgi:thiol-disulfide isomerase/thioredoxin
VHPAASGSVQSIGFTANNTTTAEIASGTTASSASITAALQALAKADQAAGYQPANEIVDPTGFINASSSFRLANIVGHQVILLDFWTYSCINCLRTIPYLDAWYQKYANQGLTIVGIHTPEFEFEKNIANVQAAVTQYGIQYPVVLDSNYGTWTAYGNLYWPHEYLIDMAGYIVHDQVGEGNYAETEAEIQKLLEQRDAILGVSPAGISTSTAVVNAVTPSGGAISPETYFGAERNEYLANGNQSATGTQVLQAPASAALTADALYLAGSWDFADQYATNNVAQAKIFYEYQAAKVYFVASAASSSSPVTVEVLQDGQPISAADAGSDVHNGVVTISGSRLYNLVSNQDGAGVHELELIIDQPGLQAYTFTFG